jgi:hypothetical protein
VLLQNAKGIFYVTVQRHKLWWVELWPIQTVRNASLLDQQNISQKRFNDYAGIIR